MPLTTNVLAKYINPIFIETGSYKGRTSIMACNMGFEVHTIEINKRFYNRCKVLFRKHNIKIYSGDSVILLPEILRNINQPSTVWLDAHPPGMLNLENCSIIHELNAILKESKRLKFQILIDDMRLFDELSMKKILNIASEIGSISYEKSICGDQDIMVIA